MHPPIVSAYAALLALLFMALSIRTLRLRRQLRIAIGDAGNPAMLRAMRVHSNFAEYVPLSLLLVYFVEVQGAQATLVRIPRQTGHRFHSKLDSDSTANWTPIPRQTGQSFVVT